jgi:hypothetical protein
VPLFGVRRLAVGRGVQAQIRNQAGRAGCLGVDVDVQGLSKDVAQPRAGVQDGAPSPTNPSSRIAIRHHRQRRVQGGTVLSLDAPVPGGTQPLGCRPAKADGLAAW